MSRDYNLEERVAIIATSIQTAEKNRGKGWKGNPEADGDATPGDMRD